MATVSTRVDVRERRSFSVGGKRRIVGAYRAAVASGEGGGVVLRREGIYQSLVFKWGRQIDDGTLGTRRRGPAATGKDPAKIRVREYGIGVHSSSPMVAIALRIAVFILTVIENRTSALRQAAATAPP